MFAVAGHFPDNMVYCRALRTFEIACYVWDEGGWWQEPEHMIFEHEPFFMMPEPDFAEMGKDDGWALVCKRLDKPSEVERQMCALNIIKRDPLSCWSEGENTSKTTRTVRQRARRKMLLRELAKLRARSAEEAS